MICIECDGSGQAWYGNRSIRAVCEICGGTGYLEDDGRKSPNAPSTPLWPVPLDEDDWRFDPK